MSNKLINNIRIICPECDCGLLRLNKLTSTIPMNPNYAYYQKYCECNHKDKRIIRIPLRFVEYEIVTTTK